MSIRWKVRRKPTPAVGDIRYVRKFLLFPKCIANEWRWLGREWIAQQYRESEKYALGLGPCQVVGWDDVRWLA